jgi:hypothetical protein
MKLSDKYKLKKNKNYFYKIPIMSDKLFINKKFPFKKT